MRPIGSALSGLALLATLMTTPALHASDGDLDLTFGLFGKAVRGQGVARAVVARADGSLRVAINRGWGVGVLALTENGAIDTSFGDNGVTMVTLDAGFVYGDSATAIFERPDGRLLIVANTDDFRQGALAQVTAAGELDGSFGTGGVRLVSHAFDFTRVYAAALQSDGKILLAGECYDCGPTNGGDTFIARFTSNGATDTTFGTNGWVLFDAVEGGTDYDYANAVAIDSAGRIVVAGSAGSDADERPYVARRLASGAADSAFAGSDGIRTLTALAEQEVTSLALDPVSGKIVVATGDRQTFNLPQTCAIARLRTNGSLDTAFSGDGIAPLTLEEGSNLHAMAIQSDGKIVAVGSINADLTPVEGFLLVRVLPDGTLDPTFDDDGRKTIEFDLETNGRDYAYAMTLSGGQIVAAGAATDGGVAQVALVRARSQLVFTDGFERGTTAGWPGN